MNILVLQTKIADIYDLQFYTQYNLLFINHFISFKNNIKFVVRLIKIALIVDIIVFSITFYVNKTNSGLTCDNQCLS